MTITVVNGSPRGATSNSLRCIRLLQKYAGNIQKEVTDTWLECTLKDAVPPETDALVIATPLYVDGLTAQMVQYLVQFPLHKPLKIYGIVNCGFWEGAQTKWALGMLECFCAERGFEWGGGIGLGTGEMLQPMESVPDEVWIKKTVVDAFNRLAAAVTSGTSLPELILTQHNYPRWLYKRDAHKGWRKQVKSHGLPVRALNARPLATKI